MCPDVNYSKSFVSKQHILVTVLLEVSKSDMATGDVELRSHGYQVLRMHWEIIGIDVEILTRSSEIINYTVCPSSTSGMKDSGMEKHQLRTNRGMVIPALCKRLSRASTFGTFSKNINQTYSFEATEFKFYINDVWTLRQHIQFPWRFYNVTNNAGKVDRNCEL